MLSNKETGMPVCLQKQAGKWCRYPMRLGTNLSGLYFRVKCTEHMCINCVSFHLLYLHRYTHRETILREDATNRRLISKGTARRGLLHAEKHSLALCLLGTGTHAARELPEPTLMSCGGGAWLSQMCPDWKSTTFSLSFVWISYQLLALACLFKVWDKAMETLVILYISTLYSNVSTDGDGFIATTLHRQNDNIFHSPV